MIDANVTDLTFVSSLDGSTEHALYLAAPDAASAPLVVGLHTWSYDRFNQWEHMTPLCRERGWSLLLPEFRGPNLESNPRARQACASQLALQDVFDALSLVRQQHGFDREALFLLGGSGGGHMALMLAARAPQLWTGVSSWVPITDLAAWHDENPDYAHHVSACLGGAPGTSDAADEDYRIRSPLSYVSELSTATLSVHHGRFDPVVPYSHSWRLALALEELKPRNFFFEIFSGEHDIHYHTAFRWFDTLHGASVPEEEHLTG